MNYKKIRVIRTRESRTQLNTKTIFGLLFIKKIYIEIGNSKKLNFCEREYRIEKKKFQSKVKYNHNPNTPQKCNPSRLQ